ncbi:hypothetical protein EGW08_000015 [Elysia chlorotica]|uniref:Uncharacterized protein n=1 Tax=Elysia chlorotica TaxID=188477 RepID=A0A433UEF1_ELYCH|nr:hypothetical protein EGW08_000015 [Elysia chlorotica]
MCILTLIPPHPPTHTPYLSLSLSLSPSTSLILFYRIPLSSTLSFSPSPFSLPHNFSLSLSLSLSLSPSVQHSTPISHVSLSTLDSIDYLNHGGTASLSQDCLLST